MNDSVSAGTSILGLVKQLAEESKTFIKEEVRLAKTEMSEKLSLVGRNSLSVAIGGFIAYAGLIVLLAALGLVIGFAFERLDLEPALAAAIGLGIIALVVISVGAVLLLKGMKAFSKECLGPARTIETLQNLKGDVIAPHEPRIESTQDDYKPTSQELEASVLATEHRIGETIEELGQRVSLTHLRHKANEEVWSHPYKWSVLAMGTGLLSGLVLMRKLRSA
jgi:hypothetical protein